MANVAARCYNHTIYRADDSHIRQGAVLLSALARVGCTDVADTARRTSLQESHDMTLSNAIGKVVGRLSVVM